AKTEYIHNKAAAYLHWKICRKYQIETALRWYEHQPSTVTENKDARIIWVMPINTGMEINANTPDTLIRNSKKIIARLSTWRNTSVKLTEKLSKYKDLEIEISRMWNNPSCYRSSMARGEGNPKNTPTVLLVTSTSTQSK
uniref:hypothetical protein n=1 Tax=Cysteiniphilum litorale TaxID=2056700 RepID=UPI003F882764